MKSCKYYFDTEAKQNYDHVHAMYDTVQRIITKDCEVVKRKDNMSVSLLCYATNKTWTHYCTLIHLLLWENVDMTFDALLAHVRPAVARHPLSLTFGAFILPKTPLFALIRSQTLAFRTSLTQKAHSNLYSALYCIASNHWRKKLGYFYIQNKYTIIIKYAVKICILWIHK